MKRTYPAPSRQTTQCKAAPGDELSRVSTGAEARFGGSRCKKVRRANVHADDAVSPKRDVGTGEGITREAADLPSSRTATAIEKRAAL